MSQLKPQTIMMAIQAVDRERMELQKSIDQADDSEKKLPDWQELELSYWKAAMDLKCAYEEALSKYDNLPPYSTLAKADQDRV